MSSKSAQDSTATSVPSYEAVTANLAEVYVISSRFGRKTTLTSVEQEMLYRRRKGMLNLLLSISGWGVFLLFLLILLPDLSHPDLNILLPEVVALVIIGSCLGLNRSGLTQSATWVFLLTMQIIIILYLLSRPDLTFLSNFRGASPLLAVTIIAAGVIIGPKFSFIFAGLSIINMFLVGIYRAKPGLASLETPLEVVYQGAVAICLFFVMACLAWFFETNFRSLIARLSSQNQSLSLANQQLVNKYEQDQQVARQVNHLTDEVSNDFTERSREAGNQISAVIEVTATIEQLDQTSIEVLESAQTVDNNAQQALKVVEEGAHRLQVGLDSLGVLNWQAEKIGAALNDLYQRIQQTGQIIELVEEITDSTNMLALNATIEAAGAGEYGRRFRAVAKEVQNLANRSQAALDQIHQVLDGVYQATTDSTMLAQQGVVEAASVMNETRSMQATLEGIVTRVETTARLAREISVAVEQQRSSTTNIVETMHYISSISSTLKQADAHLIKRVSYLNETVAQLNP